MAAAQKAPGRPRATPRRREGTSAREEILDAAAELFGRHGYAGTSTRAIALAVGIKQASLYYHFASKEQILAELLSGTVEPSLAAAGTLAASGEPVEVRLWAQVAFDVRLLCGGRWNTGALYLTPELHSGHFEGFRLQRERLRAVYHELVATGCADGVFRCDDVAVATDLVSGLVTSVVTARAHRGEPEAAAFAPAVADGCLRVLAVPARRAAVTRRRGERLLAQW